MKWMLMLVWRLVTIVVISLYRLRQTSQDVLLAITVGFLSLYNFLAQNYVHDRHSKRSSVVLNVRDYLEQRTETLIDLAEK